MIGIVIRRKRGAGVGTGLEVTAHYAPLAPERAETPATGFDAGAVRAEVVGMFRQLGADPTPVRREVRWEGSEER